MQGLDMDALQPLQTPQHRCMQVHAGAGQEVHDCLLLLAVCLHRAKHISDLRHISIWCGAAAETCVEQMGIHSRMGVSDINGQKFLHQDECEPRATMRGPTEQKMSFYSQGDDREGGKGGGGGGRIQICQAL